MKIIDNIQWLGQATVKITHKNKIIYIDPYLIAKSDKADFILITHSHYDHLSLKDIAKISSKNTTFYAPYDCVPKLVDAGYQHVKGVKPGYSEENDLFKLEAVYAYNIKKTTYHPRGNRWVGYILELDDQKIYHAGDTERIPEMKNITCDIAILPLGQTYTMNSVEDAAQSAMDVGATIAIPIHYGLYEGLEEDALKFKDILKGKINVVIK